MLVIRRQQIRALAAPGIDAYVRRAGDHLRRFFPEQVAALHPEQVDEAIRHGLDRAESYGLETEKDLLRYLTLMFVFGRSFDADGKFPWAAEILRGAGSAAERTNRLQAAALADQASAEGYLAEPEQP